jgi:hypothetical protein
VVLAVPLAEWVIPVAIMLLLYAVSFLLVKPLTWALQQIPVIGGQAAGAVANMGATVVGWARGWLDSASSPMLQVAQAVIGNVYNLLGSVVQGVEWVVASLASLTVLVVETPARILGAQQAAEAYAAQLAAQVVTTAAHDMATAETKAAALVTGAAAAATAYTNAKVAEAERLARQEAAQALTVAQADVAKVDAAAAAAVRALETTWAPQIKDIQGELGSLAGTLAGLGVGSLAVELTQLVTRVATVEENVCPGLCDAVKPQLSTLQGLADVGLMLAVFGLAAEAMRDPSGTAGLVNAAAGELHTLGHDVGSLVGLQV